MDSCFLIPSIQSNFFYSVQLLRITVKITDDTFEKSSTVANSDISWNQETRQLFLVPKATSPYWLEEENSLHLHFEQLSSVKNDTLLDFLKYADCV